MATQEVTAIVVDAIVAAFDSDLTLFTAFLKRARLETDLARIESEQRKARKAQVTANAELESEWAAQEAQRVSKLAEIDAL
jgi:hypothetical protein